VWPSCKSSLQVPIPSTVTKALFPMNIYLVPFKIQWDSTKVVRSLAMWSVALKSTVQKWTDLTSIKQLLTYKLEGWLWLKITFYSMQSQAKWPGLPQLKQFIFLHFLLPCFPHLCLYPLQLAYIPMFALISHLSLKYESLIYKLLSEKSIFLKLNMMSNIIKCLDVIIVGKVNTYVFPIAWQIVDHNLDLLFISHLMHNTL